MKRRFFIKTIGLSSLGVLAIKHTLLEDKKPSVVKSNSDKSHQGIFAHSLNNKFYKTKTFIS